MSERIETQEPGSENQKCECCAQRDRIQELERSQRELGAEVFDLTDQVANATDQRDNALEQAQDLDTRLKQLESDNAELRSETDDAMGRVEFLEAQITEPTDLVEAARKLLARLDRSLGVEHWDESRAAYDLFRSMDDLRDALRKPSSPLADYARKHQLKGFETAHGVH